MRIRRRPSTVLLAAAALTGVAVAGPLACGRGAQAAAGVPVPPALVGSWLAGDTHVHTDFSSDGSLPRQTLDDKAPGNTGVQAQLAVASVNGLAFMPTTDHRTYSQQWSPTWTSSSVLLVAGEEANGGPHATVLGASDRIVDGPGSTGDETHRHIQQSIWSARAEGASWGVAHPDDGEVVDLASGVPNIFASNVGANTVEVWNRASHPDAEVDYAEGRWNRGYRFGVVGASDDHFIELAAIAGPGSPTTSVFAADDTERSVVEGLRAGRTTVWRGPTGPMVTLAADLDGNGQPDAIGGDEVAVTAGQPVPLQIHIVRGLGTQVLVYRAPGRSAGPIATFTPTSLDQTFTLAPAALDGTSWFRVEVRGPSDPAGIDPKGLAASIQAGDPSAALALATQPDQLRAIASPLFTATGGPAVADPEVALPTDRGLDGAGTPDAATLPLAAVGEAYGFPDLAATIDGAGEQTLHLVAERRTRGGVTVAYRRLAADGAAIGAEIPLTTSTTARYPHIAAAGATVAVVWQDDRAGQVPRSTEIYLRTSRDGGRTWAPEQRITTSGARDEHPVVVLDGAGHPALAWQSNGGNGGVFDILSQTIGVDASPTNLSTDGKAPAAASPTDTRSGEYPTSVLPSIARAADGRIAVGWQDDRTDPDPLFTGRAATGEGTNPDDWDLYVAVRSAAGAWAAPLVTGAPGRADRSPDVAFDRFGALQVVATSEPLVASGGALDLRIRSLAVGATAFGPERSVDPSPSTLEQHARFGTDPDGTLRVAWFDARSADWRWRVRTAHLADDGTPVPDGVVTGFGNGLHPALAGGAVAFATDRHTRLQHDNTLEVGIVRAVAAPDPGPTAAVPEGAPLALALALVASLGAAALILRSRRR